MQQRQVITGSLLALAVIGLATWAIRMPAPTSSSPVQSPEAPGDTAALRIAADDLALPAGRGGILASGLIGTADGRATVAAVFGNGGLAPFLAAPSYTFILPGATATSSPAATFIEPLREARGEVLAAVSPTLLAPGSIGVAFHTLTDPFVAPVREEPVSGVLPASEGMIDLRDLDPQVDLVERPVPDTPAEGFAVELDAVRYEDGVITGRISNDPGDRPAETFAGTRVAAICLDDELRPTAFGATSSLDALPPGETADFRIDLVGETCDRYVVTGSADLPGGEMP